MYMRYFFYIISLVFLYLFYYGELSSAVTEEMQVMKNSNVSKTLISAGLEAKQVYSLIHVLMQYYDLNRVKIGQKLDVFIGHDHDLQGIEIKLPNKNINLIKQNNKFVVNNLGLNIKNVKFTGNLDKNNIITSVKNSGLSAQSAEKVAKLLNNQILNLKNIKSNIFFEVLVEGMASNEYDKQLNNEKLLYIGLINGTTQKHIMQFYRHKSLDGKVSMVDLKNLQKILKNNRVILRSPVHENAIITSGFGIRIDPVTKKQKKMHKGIDFAIRKGTPVKAAASGVITFIGYRGSYGNYIRIKHNDKISTAYAHLNNFAKNLSMNSKVYTGQVIGFSGETGRCTGAHLHYEVLYDQYQVDPKKYTIFDMNAKNKKYKNVMIATEYMNDANIEELRNFKKSVYTIREIVSNSQISK